MLSLAENIVTPVMYILSSHLQTLWGIKLPARQLFFFPGLYPIPPSCPFYNLQCTRKGHKKGSLKMVNHESFLPPVSYWYFNNFCCYVLQFFTHWPSWTRRKYIKNQRMKTKHISCRHIFGDKKERWEAVTMQIRFEWK